MFTGVFPLLPEGNGTPESTPDPAVLTRCAVVVVVVVGTNVSQTKICYK